MKTIGMNQATSTQLPSHQVRDDKFIDLVEDDNSDDVQIIGVVEGTANDQSSSVEFIQRASTTGINSEEGKRRRRHKCS